MADSEDERDMGDESTAQLGTPGFGMGFPQNPSRMIPDISPPRDSSDFLPTSELPGLDEGFSPFAPADESVRNQNMFGVTDSTRGIITAKSLLDLLAQNVSKADTRGGIIDRLNKSGGMVDSIRTTGFASLETSPAMTEKVKTIFDNIIDNLQIKCADIFHEVLAEIFDMIAPKICPHYSLVQQTAETSQVSPAKFKFLHEWKALRPSYESLYDNKMQIEKCRKNSTKMLSEVHQHERKKEEYMQSNDRLLLCMKTGQHLNSLLLERT
jgi:hypothetical protein